MNKLPAYVIYNSPVATTKTIAESVKQSCEEYGIEAFLFDGIWKTEAESFLQERGITLNENWCKNSEYYKDRNQVESLIEAFKLPGHQGCFASHYLLWEKCIELNTAICVFEYDVNVHRKLPEDILEGWDDVLQICSTAKGTWRHDFTKDHNFSDFKIIEYPWPHFSLSGSTGYIVKPSGAKKLIETAKEKGYLGADTFLNRDWIDYKKLSPCIATKSHEFSTVEPSKFFDELKNI